jgi:hypothetical protein
VYGSGVSVTLPIGLNEIMARDDITDINSVTLFAQCNPVTMFWHVVPGLGCQMRPVVTHVPPPPSTTANSMIVRNGEMATVTFTVYAPYDVVCTLAGGSTNLASFNHIGNPNPQSYSVTTVPLNSAQVVRASCLPTGSPMNPPEIEEVRIDVIPTVEES